MVALKVQFVKLCGIDWLSVPEIEYDIHTYVFIGGQGCHNFNIWSENRSKWAFNHWYCKWGQSKWFQMRKMVTVSKKPVSVYFDIWALVSDSCFSLWQPQLLNCFRFEFPFDASSSWGQARNLKWNKPSRLANLLLCWSNIIDCIYCR